MMQDEKAKGTTYQEKMAGQVANYSKNRDEHDEGMIESALRNYSYEIGNPRQSLKSTDVFEIVEQDTKSDDLHLTLKRTDGKPFKCIVKAISSYEGKWVLSLCAEMNVATDVKDDIATTVMALSESKRLLTPVTEEDLLIVARHLETERREEISNHNHSYAKTQYRVRINEALNIKLT